MPLYELHLKVNRDLKRQLLATLKLRFVKELAITDRFLPDRPQHPKEEIMIVNGKMRFCQLSLEEGYLVIRGREILDPDEQRAFQQAAIATHLERRKEIYAWPGHTAEAAFVHFNGSADLVFFEVAARKRELIDAARSELRALGYADEITQLYETVVPPELEK